MRGEVVHGGGQPDSGVTVCAHEMAADSAASGSMIGDHFLPLYYDHRFVISSQFDWNSQALQVRDVGDYLPANGEEGWYKGHRQKVRKSRS